MRRKPSRAPQRVSDVVWYYENPRSLTFIVEHRSGLGNYIGTIQFKVPHTVLRKSLRRAPKRMKP